MTTDSNWKLLESVWQFRMGWWHIVGNGEMVAFSDRGIVHKVYFTETDGDRESAYKLLYERATQRDK